MQAYVVSWKTQTRTHTCSSLYFFFFFANLYVHVCVFLCLCACVFSAMLSFSLHPMLPISFTSLFPLIISSHLLLIVIKNAVCREWSIGWTIFQASRFNDGDSKDACSFPCLWIRCIHVLCKDGKKKKEEEEEGGGGGVGDGPMETSVLNKPNCWSLVWFAHTTKETETKKKNNLPPSKGHFYLPLPHHGARELLIVSWCFRLLFHHRVVWGKKW